METKSTTPKRPLSDFLGVLNEKEADLLEKTIEENRKMHRKLHEFKKRIGRINMSKVPTKDWIEIVLGFVLYWLLVYLVSLIFRFKFFDFHSILFALLYLFIVYVKYNPIKLKKRK